MNSILNPYINFKDNAREAMTFYHSVFGGELTVSTFKEYNASQDPSEDDLVMHAQLEVGNGMTLMAADTPAQMPLTVGTNFTIALSGDNEAELSGYFQKLAVGGVVNDPLAKAPWGDTYGNLTDRFGISWLVNISGAPRE